MKNGLGTSPTFWNETGQNRKWRASYCMLWIESARDYYENMRYIRRI